MFEVENEVLELRFNMQKVKTIEKMNDVSLMGELRKNSGMLPFYLLESMFAVALYNKTAEQNVKGDKAVKVFESLLEGSGYANINAVTIGKLQEDMGFLFPGN